MPKRFHSSLILGAVFVLGLAAGIGGMIWAWHGLRARYFPHHRPAPIEVLKHDLGLTPTQVPQIEVVFKETGKRAHQIHAQFVPSYAKVCAEYNAVLSQEHAAWAPVRQQEMTRLQQILTPGQWQKLQQRMHPHGHRSDICARYHTEASPPATVGGRGAAGNGQPHHPRRF